MWPPHLVTSHPRAAEIPPDVVRAILLQLRTFEKHGVAPVLSLKHLSLLSGVSYKSLRSWIGRRRDGYHHYRITKRNGGFRNICEPVPGLMHVQRWINRNILQAAKPHSAAYAYVANQKNGIVKCAAMHCGAKWMIHLDLTDFFESISEKEAYRVFSNLGYSPLVAFELGRLCTTVYKGDHPRYYSRKWWRGREEDLKLLSISRLYAMQNVSLSRFIVRGRYPIISYDDARVGHLPQGAPTSPTISNLAARELDEALIELAAEFGCVYTRYADDLTFSARQLSRSLALEMIRRADKIVQPPGFRLNRKKCRIVPPGARKQVLGLLVDREQPRLTQKFKRNLEAHIHYIARFGLLGHAQRRGFDSVHGLLSHLQGKLSFAGVVDESFATPLHEKLRRAAEQEFGSHLLNE